MAEETSRTLDQIAGRTELDDLATSSVEATINGTSIENFRLKEAEVARSFEAKRLKIASGQDKSTNSGDTSGTSSDNTSTGDSAGGYEVVKEADFMITNYYPPVKNGKIAGYSKMEGGAATASGCKLVYDEKAPMGYYGEYKGKRYDYVCAVPCGKLVGGDSPPLPFVGSDGPKYGVVFSDPNKVFIAFDHFAKSPWKGKYQKFNAMDILGVSKKWSEVFTAANDAGLYKGKGNSGYSDGVPIYHGKIVDLSKPFSGGTSEGSSKAGVYGNARGRKLDVAYYNQFRDDKGNAWRGLGHVGCGTTSLAITARFVSGRNEITPTWCYDYQHGGNHYATSTLNEICKPVGVVYSDRQGGGMDAVKVCEETLSKGYPAVIHVNNSSGPYGAYAHSSHVMVVVGFDKNGDMYVHDPNNSNPKWKSLNNTKGPYALAKSDDICKHITHINYVSKCPPSKSGTKSSTPSKQIPK